MPPPLLTAPCHRWLVVAACFVPRHPRRCSHQTTMARSSKKQGYAGADKSHRRSTSMEKEAPLPPPLTNSIGGTNLQDWWASTPSHLSPTNGGFNPRPPGGFLNYLQSSQYPPYIQQHPENFHFVGVPASYAPHSSQAAQGRTMAASELGTPRFEHQPTKDFINLDVEGDIEPTRTDKRLPWTHEEDIRLASGWLENSTSRRLQGSQGQTKRKTQDARVGNRDARGIRKIHESSDHSQRRS